MRHRKTRNPGESRSTQSAPPVQERAVLRLSFERSMQVYLWRTEKARQRP